MIFFGGMLLALAACHSSAKQDSVSAAGDTPAIAKDTVKTYDASILDNKKDPVCGMPTGAGMEDTLHVNGKVIGFCSKECENEYLKDPKKFAVAYK